MLKFCLADQVEQQVQRALEGLEEDLERVRRDVQVLRQLEQRLAVQAGHRDLVDDVGRGRRRLVERGGARGHRGRRVQPRAASAGGVGCVGSVW
jgi:septation ring formation regulator EzrA